MKVIITARATSVWDVFSESAREGKPLGKSPLVRFGRACASHVFHASKGGKEVALSRKSIFQQLRVPSVCVCVIAL